MREIAAIYDDFVQAFKRGESSAWKAFGEILRQTKAFAEENAGRERDPMRLYASDLGKCPRQTMLRLMRAEKKPTSRARRMMYHAGDRVEIDVVSALLREGVLVDYQYKVEVDDFPNIGCRGDALIADKGTQPRPLEVKTVRGNAFEHDLPKQNHELQAAVSSIYLKLRAPLVFYVDRDGSHDPEQYDAPMHRDLVRAKFGELCMWRDVLPDLPPMLERVLVFRNKIPNQPLYKNVKLEPPWDCQYCDYNPVSCAPCMSKETWASSTDGINWDIKKVAISEMLDPFLKGAK